MSSKPPHRKSDPGRTSTEELSDVLSTPQGEKAIARGRRTYSNGALKLNLPSEPPTSPTISEFPPARLPLDSQEGLQDLTDGVGVFANSVDTITEALFMIISAHEGLGMRSNTINDRISALARAQLEIQEQLLQNRALLFINMSLGASALICILFGLSLVTQVVEDVENTDHSLISMKNKVDYLQRALKEEEASPTRKPNVTLLPDGKGGVNVVIYPEPGNDALPIHLPLKIPKK